MNFRYNFSEISLSKKISVICRLKTDFKKSKKNCVILVAKKSNGTESEHLFN